MLQPRFEILPFKILVGRRVTMSMADDQTVSLWRGFMQHRKEILNAVGSDLFSVQVFDPSFNFAHFNPLATFDKWAAVEVSDVSCIPDGMEAMELSEGLYAVFIHKGGPRMAVPTFTHIYGEWLPASDYEIDHRPHFEIMGEKYKGDDPESEEEVWIPVKKK